MASSKRQAAGSLPNITIITPSLNQGRFLERAICSVLDQGYRGLEYIIADGDSTDETAELIEFYRGDLTAVIREADEGPADAVNKALERATGDVVGVLCADDLLMPGALDTVARAFAQPGGPQWLVGHALHVDEDDGYLGQLVPDAPKSLASYLKHDSGFLPGVSTFYRRGLFDRVGGFEAKYHQAFDYEMSCRLLAKDIEPAILPQALAARREHAEARMSTHPIERGVEYINAARLHARKLPLAQRSALWVNCDYRERIYTLAQAERCGEDAQLFLLKTMIRRPWWLANHTLRSKLLQGAAA